MASFAFKQKRDRFLGGQSNIMDHACTKAGDRLAELLARLQSLDEERAAIVAEVEALRTKAIEDPPAAPAVLSLTSAAIHGRSPIQAKIALFQRLFRGRADVFPVRWENAIKRGRKMYH
jgi:hypothetical protein